MPKLANVTQDDLQVTLRAITGEVLDDFEKALAELGEPLGFNLMMRRVPDAEAIRFVAQAFAATVIEQSSVDWEPQQWGDWAGTHPDEFYQLLAVAEHHEKWGDWANDGA